MKRITLFLQTCKWMAMAGLLVLAGCENKIEPQETKRSSARTRVNQSITEVVVASPNFTLLEAAVIKAGLADALAGGNLTVFAPTDAAFMAAGFDANAINNANADALRRILLFHVIGNARVFSSDIPMQLTGVLTLQGDKVEVIREQFGSVSVNGNVVAQADLEANNGVIHVIDQVLLPSAGNPIEIAVRDPNLTYLVAAVQRTGLANALVVNALTIFAPTNAAFQAAGFPTIASIQAADEATLRRILLYHVSAGKRFTPQLGMGELETLEGRRLATTMTTVQGLGNASPANIRVKNVNAISSVIHVIDQVLLPDGGNAPQTITDIVVGNPDFSLLRAAAIRTGLASALAMGNLTVFAPTNAAFQAAGFADENAINNANVDMLRRILLLHVIGNERLFADQLPMQVTPIRTLQGGEIWVFRNQRGVFVNGFPVIQGNVRASNGVIHVINRVLMTPGGNIVEVAVGNPNLTYLVAAVQRAELVQTLVTNTFTVFAPTNAAFQAAGFPTIASIQAADPAVLRRILLYHVVSGRAYAGTLTPGNVPTALGETLAIDVSPTMVSVKGKSNTDAASVVVADVNTFNGVVHVVNKVLLP